MAHFIKSMIRRMWSPEKIVEVRLIKDSQEKKVNFSDFKPDRKDELEDIFEKKKTEERNLEKNTSLEVSSSLAIEEVPPIQIEAFSRGQTHKKTVESQECLYSKSQNGNNRPRKISKFNQLLEPRNLIPLKFMKEMSEKVQESRDVKQENKLESVLKESMKRVDAIIRNHDLRVAQDEAIFRQSEFLHKKQKLDIFKWMKLPGTDGSNSLLQKMVRVRLLEIFADVE